MSRIPVWVVIFVLGEVDRAAEYCSCEGIDLETLECSSVQGDTVDDKAGDIATHVEALEIIWPAIIPISSALSVSHVDQINV